jgi:putative ABC transport system permease protein
MQIPGVENATMASDTPVDIGAGYKIDIDGVEEDPNLIIRGLRAHPDFNETLDIAVVAGRDLRHSDYTVANRPGEEGEREYAFLLNEAAVETFGLKPEEIVGRRASMHGRLGTVVGVVEDFHFVPLHKEIEPLVIFPSQGYNKVMVGLSTDDVSQTLSKTRDVWEAMFPGYPFEYEFLDQEYEALYRQEQRAGHIFTSFALLAIFVACLGLFGLASYMVEQRTKEIGVRKVLGATVSNIVGLFSRDFVVLVFVGFALAVPVAWYVMGQWLQSFAYRIDIHYSLLIVAGLLTLMVALLTVSYQAIKAALMNPVSSLRSE